MIKVKGCLAGSTKYSILRSVSMEAYWADQENGKFDSLYWGTKVRLYISRKFLYDAMVKIYLKSVPDEKIIINEDSIVNLIPSFFQSEVNYYEFYLEKYEHYNTLIKNMGNVRLCCEVSSTLGFYFNDCIASIKIESQFCDPLVEMQIRRNRASNLFGKVRNNSTKNHQGFDYYANQGTNIIAVANSIVDRIVDSEKGDYGKQLVLKLDRCNYYAFYAHLSEITVKVGDIVHKGDIIGKTGITGNAKSMKGADQHLHFECRTSSNLGIGLIGRISPNNVVLTKFYSQDESKPNQSNLGVKKIDNNGNVTLMNIQW